MYVVRGPRGNKDIGEIQILSGISSTSDEIHSDGTEKAIVYSVSKDHVKAQTDDLSSDLKDNRKTQMGNVSDVVKVVGLETAKPVTVTDHQYVSILQNRSNDKRQNMDSMETNNIVSVPLNAGAPSRIINANQNRGHDAEGPRIPYACRNCYKLFVLKSECINHEKVCQHGQKSLVGVSAGENSAGLVDLGKTDKRNFESVEVGMDKDESGIKTLAEYSDAQFDLTLHRTPVSKTGSFYCSHCSKVHLQGQTETTNCQPVQRYCEICKFSTSRNIRNHWIAVHTRRCGGCGNYVVEKEPWADGVKKHHERYATCPNCENIVVFFSSAKLNSGAPKATVSPNKERKVLSKNKERKLLSEEGKELYECDFCDRIFGNLKDRQDHQYKHADGKRYICNVCERYFKHERSLHKHMKIHQDSSVPFHCSMCNVDFEHKRYYDLHMQKKHGGNMLDDKNQSDDV